MAISKNTTNGTEVSRLEGTGATKMIQLIQQHGYNKDVDIELATVTSQPPSLRIKVDNMDVELENNDLIVAQTLTKHTRTVTIGGGAPTQVEFTDELGVGERVIVASVDNGQTFIVLDRAVTY